MKCFICGKEIEVGQDITRVVGETPEPKMNPLFKEYIYDFIKGRPCHTECLTEEVKAEIRAGKR